MLLDFLSFAWRPFVTLICTSFVVCPALLAAATFGPELLDAWHAETLVGRPLYVKFQLGIEKLMLFLNLFAVEVPLHLLDLWADLSVMVLYHQENQLVYLVLLASFQIFTSVSFGVRALFAFKENQLPGNADNHFFHVFFVAAAFVQLTPLACLLYAFKEMCLMISYNYYHARL